MDADTTPAASESRDCATPPDGELTRIEADGAEDLPALVFRPRALAKPAPVLVTVHGISRNALEQLHAFAPGAARRGWVVVAPSFRETTHGDYQRLGRRGRGPRADLALDRLLAALIQQGIASRSLALFGYSGGGQFVHRYVMAHPERVRAAAVAAAGWYTLPDSRRRFPRGLRVGADLPGVRLRPAAFLRVPMLVAVGELDVAREESLRRSPGVDRDQGRDRVARARHWVDVMRGAATQRGIPHCIELALLPAAGHSFEACAAAGLTERVLDFFEPRLPDLQEDS